MKLVTGFEQARSLLDRTAAGAGYPLSPGLKNRIEQMFGVSSAEEAVAQIVEQVKRGGDKALQQYARLIDGVDVESIEVPGSEIQQAFAATSGEITRAMQISASRIKAFHDSQRRAVVERVEINSCIQVCTPLKKVGVYAPGGTACYPSSVLMTAIPARCAGVEEVILATPPGKNGRVPSLTLAAAQVAGVDRVFAIGGAQAVAALAYGTESVPRVDKICGPGNIFVMLAKKQVFGTVDIDGLQGPSEVLIVADDSADPENVVFEILAQSEHDPMAQSILITTSRDLAERVSRVLPDAAARLIRSDITQKSIDAYGSIVVVENLEQAAELANLYAPEHLVLDIAGKPDYTRFYNAGCIFTGQYPTVAMGDYVCGPSHALPTSGTARFSSPLNVASFMRYYNVVEVNSDMMNKLGPAAAELARAEGFTAHAMAVENRLKKQVK